MRSILARGVGMLFALGTLIPHPADAAAVADAATEAAADTDAGTNAGAVIREPATVTIDGVEWRPAPPGTRVDASARGSRVLIDGAPWLRADDPRHDAEPEAETPSVPAMPNEPDESDDDEAAVNAAAEEIVDWSAYTDPATSSLPVAALRLPPDVRGSSNEYGYVQVTPTRYDFGGAGLMLEGSAEVGRLTHVFARAGVAEGYRELLVGAGIRYRSLEADRLTVSLSVGVEYGAFALGNSAKAIGIADEDAGLWIGASGRLVVSPRFELEGGVAYSAFHGGDPSAFGGGFFHLDRRLDLMSRFEIGDNDSISVGLRYYYR